MVGINFDETWVQIDTTLTKKVINFFCVNPCVAIAMHSGYLKFLWMDFD